MLTQSDGRETCSYTVVLHCGATIVVEDAGAPFMLDWNMYDTLSEGKIINVISPDTSTYEYTRYVRIAFRLRSVGDPSWMACNTVLVDYTMVGCTLYEVLFSLYYTRYLVQHSDQNSNA